MSIYILAFTLWCCAHFVCLHKCFYLYSHATLGIVKTKPETGLKRTEMRTKP